MQDFYTFIVNGTRIPEQDQIITDREQAIMTLTDLISEEPQDAIEVIKSNPSDNTCYYVTGDIAEASFDEWDNRADQDEPMPYLYDKLGFKRMSTYDNREHAEDYRAWAMPRAAQ